LLEEQTQAPPEILLRGGTVQSSLVVYVAAHVVGVVSATTSTLTRTGTTAPVVKENDPCPRTLNMEAISP
jgi:hypothetical protein